MKAQILIIDDEPAIRHALRTILESEGYSVQEAQQGEIAMQLVREHPIDLAIVDLFMPEQDGVETILQMRRLAPQVKIIAISGGGQYGLTGVLQVARLIGADRILAKPFDMQELLTTIHTLLDGDMA
jgi:two-component system, chemotaxis family, chemotaxis protein CheY